MDVDEEVRPLAEELFQLPPGATERALRRGASPRDVSLLRVYDKIRMVGITKRTWPRLETFVFRSLPEPGALLHCGSSMATNAP